MANITEILLNNNKTDNLGNYTLIDVGTPTYSAVIKIEGTHSLSPSGNSSQNIPQFPAQIMTDINLQAFIGIDLYGYHATGQRYAFYTAKGSAIAADFLWAYTDADTDQFIYRWDDNVSYMLAIFTAPGDLDTWFEWTFEWDGDLEVYKDGSLEATNVTIGNSFGGNNAEFVIGGEGVVALANNSYTDRYIIADSKPGIFPYPLTVDHKAKILKNQFPRNRFSKGDFK